MLAQLGAVQFTLLFNMHETQHEASAEFAAHPVVGRMPPLESVGEGPETWTVRGRLFPHRFGGLDGLGRLHAMRAAGAAQYFMRGDGAALGWVVVEKVTETSTYLDAAGIGRIVEFEVTVKRAPSPGPLGALAAIAGLLG